MPVDFGNPRATLRLPTGKSDQAGPGRLLRGSLLSGPELVLQSALAISAVGGTVTGGSVTLAGGARRQLPQQVASVIIHRFASVVTR